MKGGLFTKHEATIEKLRGKIDFAIPQEEKCPETVGADIIRRNSMM
jgi:hypothetical protein